MLISNLDSGSCHICPVTLVTNKLKNSGILIIFTHSFLIRFPGKHEKKSEVEPSDLYTLSLPSMLRDQPYPHIWSMTRTASCSLPLS